MSTERYDVVILGGGNAAMGATVRTREAGLSVAMVEMRDLGGTCPNRGCMPKKVLVAAAHALDEIARAHHHGITVAAPSLDWAALIAREKEMIAGIPDSLAAARLSGMPAIISFSRAISAAQSSDGAPTVMPWWCARD